MLVVNYNYGHFLPQALDSVLRQSYPDFELIICDDGSQDDSPRIIRSFAKRFPHRIRYVLKENGGVASALNAAYRLSRGDIVALLDADDLFATEKLSHVAKEFLAKPEVGLVVNRMVKMSSDGETIGLIPQVGRLDKGWIRDRLLRAGGHWSFAPASGISLRRECSDEIFPIPEISFRTEADAYIFTQAPLRWAVGAISEPLSFYRLHSTNTTASDRVTPAFAESIASSIERSLGALDETAVNLRLPRPRLQDNPVYSEMMFVRDYLRRERTETVRKRLFSAYRTAFRCRTGDWMKVMAKPFVLTAVAVLPPTIGVRVLNAMYMPSEWRNALTHRVMSVR